MGSRAAADVPRVGGGRMSWVETQLEKAAGGVSSTAVTVAMAVTIEKAAQLRR